MVRFLLLLPLLTGCSTLLSAGSAAGGAALGSLAGPGGAAIGGAAGVVAVELMNDEVSVDSTPPVGGVASTVHETTSLVETIGLWYLLIFVLLPLLTKRGRGWLKNFASLHNTLSKEDMDDMDTAQSKRFDNIEKNIESLKNGGK